MWKWLKAKFKATWQKIKDWSGWSSAGTIFISRMEVLAGFLAAALLGVDWNSIISMDFSHGFTPGILITGGVLILKGFLSEATRRHNAPELA